MNNTLQIAQWYAAKASKEAANGNMTKAQDLWQTAMERFAEYHYQVTQKVEDIV